MSETPNLQTADPSQCAVAYVRMSTDKQKFSIENQLSVITMYAEKFDIKILKVFSDEGRSGLTFSKRPALKQLIEAVLSDQADFRNILIYDVSRWGRFQDIDESAYYEYTCRKAGFEIHYVTESFGNGNDSYSSLMKSIKRIMAAEYSKDISLRILEAKRNCINKGFHVGGKASYGLRRQLIDERGRPKEILEHGQRKYLLFDRVVLVPGPQKEQKVVKWIFHKFALKNHGERRIATELNKMGVKSDTGKK